MINTTHNFKKIESQYIKELDATAYIYKHERLGTKLLHIPNNDPNKVFSIEFATLPQDDTGVAHILEHAVLAGSEKFPVKEPFVNLLKGSLNTFLNAMTFSDKTMYPFASLNEKDFLNILDVYLDAVFAPNIKSDPLILKQEGWRIEQFSEDQAPVFNGVVFNEMKGALASPDAKLNSLANKALYDNTYQYESGGDPRFVTDLTEENFLDFYDANYHPSNAFVYLYGDIDKNLVFTKLEERFATYQTRSNLPQNKATTKLSQPQYVESTYPAIKDDLNYAQISLVNPKIKSEEKPEREYALQIAMTALFNLESSQIKRSVIESGIAQDIYAYTSSNSFNPDLTIVLVGIKEGLSPQDIENIIWEELAKAFDKDQSSVYAAALNNLSFSMREGDSQSLPQGLIYGIMALINWPYGSHPFTSLAFEDHLKKVAGLIEDKSINSLVRKYTLDNAHRVTVLIRPDENLAEQNLLDEKTKLDKMFQNLDAQAKKDNIQMNLALRQKQETPDSKEALRSLPVLTIEDIEASKDYQMVEETSLSNGPDTFPVLTYFGPSRGIAYLNYQFDLKQVKQENLFELSLFQSLLGMLNTKNYSYEDLTNEVLAQTGGISCTFVYGKKQQFLNVRVKLLRHQIQKGLYLLEEILNHSDFSNAKDRIHQLLTTIYSRLQSSLADDGMAYGRRRLNSYLSDQGAFDEEINGISFFQKLKDCLSNWDKTADPLLQKLESFKTSIINQANFSLFYAGEANLYEEIKEPLLASLANYSAGDNLAPQEIWSFDLRNKKEAFIIPAEIQFNLAGGRLKEIEPNWNFEGSIHLLRQILNTDYLWTKIRVSGGAYGAGFTIDRKGNLVLSSYRDPQCAKTFEAYRAIPDYLRNLELEENEWESYLIGTFASLDQPYSFSAMSQRARTWYYQGITADQMQKERSQLLNAKPQDLKKYADLIEAVLNEQIYTSVGSGHVLRENQSLFKTIKHLE